MHSEWVVSQTESIASRTLVEELCRSSDAADSLTQLDEVAAVCERVDEGHGTAGVHDRLLHEVDTVAHHLTRLLNLLALLLDVVHVLDKQVRSLGSAEHPFKETMVPGTRLQRVCLTSHRTHASKADLKRLQIMARETTRRVIECRDLGGWS